MKKIYICILCLAMMMSMGCGEKSLPKENTEHKAPNKDQSATDQTREDRETESKKNEDEIQSMMERLLTKANEVVVEEHQVRFTDDLQEGDIVLPKKMEPVAVLYGSLACLWVEAGGKVDLALGGEHAIDLYKRQIGRDITQDEGVDVVALTPSAKKWDMEIILSAQPAVIFLSTAMNAPATMAGPAEVAKIPMVTIAYQGVEDYLKWFKVFSALNEREDLWESVALKTAREVAEVLVRLPEERPKVLAIMPHSKGVSAYFSHSELGTLIEDLGGENVLSPMDTKNMKKISIDLETIYSLDPDIILIKCLDSEDYAKEHMEKNFGDSPLWKDLRAVKENKVFFLSHDLYHNRPNRMYGEAYKQLAEILHPEMKEK